jgi:hypothetical protein
MKSPRKNEFTSEELLYIRLLKREFSFVTKIFFSGDHDYKKASTFINEYCNKGKKITEVKENTIGHQALRRLWGKEKPERYTYPRNLDSIAASIDLGSWANYIKIRKRDITLTSLFDPRNEEYDISKMRIGHKFILGWMPTRFIELEYIGEYQFRILNLSDNINRKIGDIIESHGFRLLYSEQYNEVAIEDHKKTISGYPLYPKIILEKTETDPQQLISDYFFI